MQTARLKEYLKMLVDLEKQIYTQEMVIANLEYTIPRLGYRRNIYEPEKVKDMSMSDETANDLLVGIFLLVGGLLIGIMMKFIVFLVVPSLILAGIFFIAAWVNYSKDLDWHNERMKEYNRALQNYRAAVLQDSVRVENELKRKVLLETQLKELKNMNAKTKMTLQKLYNRNIIHQKYQGLIPVCSLYGYFDTGVCTQLEGHEGAYNKYDTESRLDYIICKIDEVLKHLEEIKNNQYQLYAVIQESNAQFNELISNTNYMMGQLDGIQAQGAQLDARVASLQMTSALTLYETACNRQETAYLRRMTEWGY